MTTFTVAPMVLDPVLSPLKKKRVLLIDASPTKREIRADSLRKLGIDVDCAADISEARSWWRAALYNLVLMNVENDMGHRDKFCDDIRRATPPQQFAFLVGGPAFLADLPVAEVEAPSQRHSEQSTRGDIRAALAADISGDLGQR